MKLRFHNTACCWFCLISLSILFLGIAQPARAQNEPVQAEIDVQAEIEPGQADELVQAEMIPGEVTKKLGEPAERGFGRNEALIASLTIFSLAIFVGFEVITKVPPTLHTPLMSGSNAISGITLVGAALVAGGSDTGFAALLGMLAVVLAAINAVGGFMVTDRMLAMFKKK